MKQLLTQGIPSTSHLLADGVHFAQLYWLESKAPRIFQPHSHGEVCPCPIPWNLGPITTYLTEYSKSNIVPVSFQAQDLKNWQFPFPIILPHSLFGKHKTGTKSHHNLKVVQVTHLQSSQPLGKSHQRRPSRAERNCPAKPCPNCRFVSKIKVVFLMTIHMTLLNNYSIPYCYRVQTNGHFFVPLILSTMPDNCSIKSDMLSFIQFIKA